MAEHKETPMRAEDIAIDVVSYGADPTGRTDSFAAFQRAIDHAARLPRVVVRAARAATDDEDDAPATGTVV